MRVAIKDGRNIALAYIDDNKRLFDRTGGKLLATYNPGTNSTYSAGGKLIGKGNLLLTQVK